MNNTTVGDFYWCEKCKMYHNGPCNNPNNYPTVNYSFVPIDRSQEIIDLLKQILIKLDEIKMRI